MNYIGEKRPLGICLFFSLISLGLFNIYWAYTVTYEINAVLDEHHYPPIIEVIGCILTLGLYLIYWLYKYEKLIVKISKEQGVPCKDRGLLMSLLAVVLLFPVSMMMMQKQLNNLWESA